MSVEGIPIWMVEPMEALTSEAIALVCDGDDETSKLNRKDVMIVRVPCR